MQLTFLSATAIGNNLNGVVLMSGMSFSKQQRNKLSMLGRLHSILGGMPEPAKRQIEGTPTGRKTKAGSQVAAVFLRGRGLRSTRQAQARG